MALTLFLMFFAPGRPMTKRVELLPVTGEKVKVGLQMAFEARGP